eukprot:1189067-Prorocentrum_minimum.AAC.3
MYTRGGGAPREVVGRGVGGGCFPREGKYRSSVDVREPQSLTKSEEYQKHLQGVSKVCHPLPPPREGVGRGGGVCGGVPHPTPSTQQGGYPPWGPVHIGTVRHMDPLITPRQNTKTPQWRMARERDTPVASAARCPGPGRGSLRNIPINTPDQHTLQVPHCPAIAQGQYGLVYPPPHTAIARGQYGLVYPPPHTAIARGQYGL